MLLSAPIDVVLARVRERSNPVGSTAEDRAKIALDLASFEALLRSGAGHEIVTTISVSAVVEAVEEIAAGVR